MMNNYLSLSATGLVVILLSATGYSSLASQRDTQSAQSVAQMGLPSDSPTVSPSPAIQTTPSPTIQTTPSPSIRTTPSPTIQTTPSPSIRTTPSPSVTPSVSPSPQTTGESSSDTSKSPDLAFMIKAAQGSMSEIELGQLAQKKASSSQVKQFAQLMIDDHSQINTELMKLFQQKGITPPTTVGEKYTKMRDQLTPLSGQNFDRAYMKLMVEDHVEDVVAFQREANSGKDPQVREFAGQMLPALDAHLQLARMLDQSLMGNQKP